MIDFNQRLHDTDKFRQAAIFFQQHGCYTLAPRGTTDYNKYWEQETDRCLNGYTAPDGEGITGYNYFYLNYSPIMRLKEEEYTDREGNLRKRRQRILEFPSFWDYDYYLLFNSMDAIPQLLEVLLIITNIGSKRQIDALMVIRLQMEKV